MGNNTAMEGVLAQVKALSETTTNNRNTILHYSLLASLTYLIVQGKPGLNSLLLFHFCVKVIMLVELSLMKDVTKEMYRTEEQFGSALFWNAPLLGILKTIVCFFLVSLPFNEYSVITKDRYVTVFSMFAIFHYLNSPELDVMQFGLCFVILCFNCKRPNEAIS